MVVLSHLYPCKAAYFTREDKYVRAKEEDNDIYNAFLRTHIAHLRDI